MELVAASGTRRVGMLGLSFKVGTDDLRESPFVILAETLLGKGYELRIYDEDVRVSRLVGRNLEYVNSVFPHVARLLVTDLEAMVAESEVLIVGKTHLRERVSPGLLREGHVVIELARVGDWGPARATGIAW
jgi:GDP-mannose 6-dehydrogenase